MRRVFVLALMMLCPLAGQGPGAAPATRQEQYPFFKDAEVRLINDFYRPGSGNSLPGNARKGAEPQAGLAKQLRRGGVLPSGMEKKLEQFPGDLERRIGPPPPGYRRWLCGNWALLVQESGNLIVDLLDLSRH